MKKTQSKLVYAFTNETTFRVVGQEQVKVPAGTFQAFKVVLTQKGEFGAKGTSQPINYTRALALKVAPRLEKAAK